MRAIARRLRPLALSNPSRSTSLLPQFVAVAVAFVAFGWGLQRNRIGRTHMDALQRIKGWIGSLTEIGLMLLALAIVAALLVGANLPFFGNVTNNIMALVKGLGDAGLVGLITLGVILWLSSGRKVAYNSIRAARQRERSARCSGGEVLHPAPQGHDRGLGRF